MARQGSRSKTELESVVRRALALPYRQQLKLVGVLEEQLGARLSPSKRSEEVARRERVLNALDAAAAHLELPKGDRVTTTQFARAAAELGLDVTVHDVVAAFGRWRFGVDAHLGGSVPETSSTRALKRATAGIVRSYEDYLFGLRAWLSTRPPCRRMEDYDAFVAEKNSSLGEGELPLVRAGTITHQLAVRWTEAIALAEGHVTLEQLQPRVSHLLPTEDGHGALVGLTTVARLLDVGIPQALRMTHRDEFPSPVADIGGRVWLRSDIEAYRAGSEAHGVRLVEFERAVLQNKVVAARVGLTDGSVRRYLHLRRFDLVPEPAGRVGGAWWWWKDDVSTWLERHSALVNSRRETGHGAVPDQTRRSQSV